jgi:hypothetical protein
VTFSGNFGLQRIRILCSADWDVKQLEIVLLIDILTMLFTSLIISVEDFGQADPPVNVFCIFTKTCELQEAPILWFFF